ncbi:MAG TPA: hypothetical protein VEC12_09425, partial [Bacteroidia bacterium]|nr:hypothetical protein [Bacteroidia bacterium]
MPGKFILTILLVHIALYTLRGQERTYTHIFSPNNIEEGSWITNGKERKMARASCYVTMQPQEQAEEDDTCFRHTMTYDSKGRLVEIIFINESKRTNYVYDDKDRVIQYSEKYFEEDGETGEEYSEYILHLSITYDPSGKISAVSNKLTESDDVVSFIPKEEKLQIKNKQFEFTDLVYFKNGCIQTVLNIFDYDGDTTYLEKYTYDD